MMVEYIVENMHPLVSMSGGIELFAALISLIFFIGSFFEPYQKNPVGKTLSGLLLSNTLMQTSDAFLWFLLDVPEYVTLVKVLNFISYASGISMLVLYVYCMLLYISQKKPVSMKPAYLMSVLGFLATTAWFLSNFNGMYYHFDENGVYCDGPLAWVNLLIWYGMFFYSALVVFTHRKTLGWRETGILISFGILPILAFPLDAIWPITPRYMATTLSIIMVYKILQVAQSKRLLEMDLELADSRVKLLMGQIQPHFIFNSLQAIEELCVEDPPKAGQTVRDFSKYLRGNLDAMSCDHLIPFSREIEHIRHYLAVEQSDPESRLEINYDLSAADFNVPPLSVQPIVENAVRHGIGTRSKGGKIDISSLETKDAFLVTVADDGTGFTSATEKQNQRQSIGLQNVRARLDAQCGGTLHIETGETGTLVTIIIPKGAHR